MTERLSGRRRLEHYPHSTDVKQRARVQSQGYNSPMGYAGPDAVTQIANGLNTTTFAYDNAGKVTSAGSNIPQNGALVGRIRLA